MTRFIATEKFYLLIDPCTRGRNTLNLPESVLNKHVGPWKGTSFVERQEPGHGVLIELVETISERLVEAADELLVVTDGELSSTGLGGEAEAEEIFLARTAVLRCRELLMLSPAACDNSRLSDALDTLLKACSLLA